MPKQQIAGNQWISLWQTEQGSMTVKMEDGVAIIPMNSKGEVLLITEPSVAYDGLRSYLLPTGAIEADEDPTEAANRELQEEMGFKAGRLDALGVLYLNIKYVEMKSHIFLARDLEASQLQGDEPSGWIEQVDPITLDQIEALIAEGQLLNSSTIAALFMARSFIKEQG